MSECRCKKNILKKRRRLKQRQAWKEEHWQTAWARRAPVGKNEVQWELKLARDVVGNMSFCNYFSNKIIKNMWKHYWVRQWWMTGIQCSFCLSLLFSKVDLKKQQERGISYVSQKISAQNSLQGLTGCIQEWLADVTADHFSIISEGLFQYRQMDSWLNCLAQKLLVNRRA